MCSSAATPIRLLQPKWGIFILEDYVLWVNADLYTPSRRLADGRLLVGPDGKIEAVGGTELDPSRLAVPGRLTVKDAGGCKLLPGFVDVHVHGGGGHDGMAGREALLGMSRYHSKHGTTSFLPTVVCADRLEMVRAIRAWRDMMESGESALEGAEAAGIHIEGPFLNPIRGGAQNREHLRRPDREEMLAYLEAAGPWTKMVTIAPELEGAGEVLRLLRDRGITVSAGHTNATFEQMREAVELGVTHMTHHFNGMSPLLAREPGATGAGLQLANLTIELIVDGYHIHPEMVAMAFALKPADRIVLITDAMLCAGCPDGDYMTEGVRIRMENGKVMLADGSSLAGSSLNMLQALKNTLAYTGLPLERVLPSLTSLPARQAGLSAAKGSLDPGMDADFILIDEKWQLRSTHVKGKEVFRS